MKTKRENPIPEFKLKTVKELEELMKNKRTILITSIKNIPGSQFQEIVKKLRGKAIVKVPKKNLIFRALDKVSNEEMKKLKEKMKDSFAILFSELESFELAAVLAKNKTSTKAKAGQEAPMDIEIPAGPTELVPGPAISELGALGIQIQIEKGKISIKEPKIVAKEGEKIKKGAADLMAKLDIKPFKIGFIPLGSFDTKENIFYNELKVNMEEAIENLKNLYGKAFSLAINLEYFSKDTIGFIIGKAASYEKKLIRVINGEPEPVMAPKGVPPVEGDVNTEGKEIKKEEPKEASSAGLGALFG